MQSFKYLTAIGQSPKDVLYMFWNLYKLEVAEFPGVEALTVTDAAKLPCSEFEPCKLNGCNQFTFRPEVEFAGRPALFSVIFQAEGLEVYTSLENGETFMVMDPLDLELVFLIFQAIIGGFLPLESWPYWVDGRNKPGFVNLIVEDVPEIDTFEVKKRKKR